MFKNHNMLGVCLTLALSVAGFSDAQALVIDTFDEGPQSAPPTNEIAVQSAIGGYRLLEQPSGENQISVLTGPNAGTLSTGHRGIGGRTRVEWNGDGGLGGIDLTLSGDRFLLRNIAFNGTVFPETLTLRVTDQLGGVSQFTENYSDICGNEFGCLIFQVPFSRLSSGAKLTDVDKIALDFETFATSDGSANIAIGSIQVVDPSAVPIPAAAWLFGSGLLGLVGMARRKKTA